jgi:glycosyltransferase involved in cell wall biosynthesis
MLAARLARRLRDRYEFVFACLDSIGTLGAELKQEGFAVEWLHRHDGVDFGCVRRLAQFAAESQAKLIQAHQYTPFFYSRAPGWWGYRPPVLFTEHGRTYPDVPSFKRRWFNRLRLRSVDRVVAVGEAVKRALIEKEAITANRIEVIYNGAKMDDFTTNAAQRATIRKSLGIRAEEVVAIQVARLDYLKDHLTALRTAERVRRRLPHFRLLLVGEGPEREKIERELQSRNLSDTVIMLGLRTDVQALLSAADLFLLTSISEGIPVTFLEAMAARLPIVSTDVGGVNEVVVDRVTGRLAPAGDDEQLARCIEEVFTNPPQAQAMGLAGSRRAQEKFTEEQMHAAYSQLFDSLLKRT